MGTYIFDIDGTLSDASHRLHHIKHEKSKDRNWPAFFEECAGDEVIDTTAYLCQLLFKESYIVLCTGRNEKYRDLTEKWLNDNSIGYDMLLMRADGDYREDAIVKKELIENSDIELSEIRAVFEDRSRVVQMWRDMGLLCYQVTNGDY